MTQLKHVGRKNEYGKRHRVFELSADEELEATNVGKKLADTILLLVDDRIEESILLRALLSPGKEEEAEKMRSLVIRTMKKEVSKITT